ncbi:right-handed parallel beta-helix repeat-containing protein [Sandarakinorhabdus rubra]|uniref:right-handed parallel beta-helix repeat-containing protein n=1 Tax=Sandarakinorhabdus rubra TaxID=2672568 RepID=UPI0013DD46B4|nr:right-handed parallel beta-helix repeat-containing protein [Sandarakinorhabdus rubra]
MISVSCAALAVALANPASTGPFRLTQDCPSPDGRPALVNTQIFRAPVTVEAAGRTVAGLAVKGGGNLVWKGGTIRAPLGSGIAGGARGAGLYAVLITGGARGIAFDNVTFTRARKAIVMGGASGLSVRNSRCVGEVEDCLIVTKASDIDFSNNVAGPFQKNFSSCTLPDGRVEEKVGRKQCQEKAGAWKDGWHSDVVQMYNAVHNVTLANNRFDTIGHGITQFGPGEPLRNVTITGNTIRAGRNGLRLNVCENCRIEGNRLESAVPEWRAVIMPGTALACGNIVPSGGLGREKC